MSRETKSHVYTCIIMMLFIALCALFLWQPASFAIAGVLFVVAVIYLAVHDMIDDSWR